MKKYLSTMISLGLMSSAFAGQIVSQSTKNDTSPPLREMIKEGPSPDSVSYPAGYVVPNIFLKAGDSVLPSVQPPWTQRQASLKLAPTPTQSFDAISSALASSFVLPPDTNGDIGGGKYVQWVNSHFAVFDATNGARLSGPTAGNVIFNGFGGPCQTRNDGDPIVVYDDAADRWVLSQFTSGGATVSVPFRQCVAISTTNDPLGPYNRYEFTWPNTAGAAPLPIFGDYPHIGVWTEAGAKQNAYTMVTHDFTLAPNVFRGASFIAMERDKMLLGQPAAMVRFGGQANEFGAQPIHIEGTRPAQSNVCPLFAHFTLSGSYKFNFLCPNWGAVPSLSPTRLIATGAPISPLATDVSQPGTTATLDTFPQNLMYRATARQFENSAPQDLAITLNHSVEVGTATSQGAVKWAHLNLRVNDTFATKGFENTSETNISLVDQGAFAPDSTSRWMGAIAMDKGGNIGLGYSAGSATLAPKLRLTGRETTDPVGQMQSEVDCTPASTGVQTSTSQRWGDYASMSVDTDDCSFWFTSEYYTTTSAASWSTRVCKFAFPSCTAPKMGLGLNRNRVEACKATVVASNAADLTSVLQARLGAYNGFTAGSASLSSTGFPAGFSFSATGPIPSVANFDLKAATAADGDYSGTLILTSGVATSSQPLSVGLSTVAPSAPTLAGPANAAVDAKINPTLSWTAPAGTNVTTYKVEVATDAAFSNIVRTVNVTGTSVAIAPLAPSTQYFWRVTAANYCGPGAVSAVRSFTTTGSPGLCPTGTTAVTIFSDNFTAANGWTASGNGVGTAWALATAPVGTGFTSQIMYVPNFGPASGSVTSDQSITSPNIAIPAGASNVTLSYDAYHSFEVDTATSCWDGAAWEVKVGANSTYLTGDRMYTDPFSGPITDGAPLAGRNVWCAATAAPPIRSVVDLDGFAGQNINLVMRVTADTNTAAPAPNGMAMDNLRVDYCQ